MGNYTTIKIGPFIKIKTIKEPHNKKIMGCVEHGANNGGKYCSKCGEKLKEHIITKYWNTHIEDILGCDEMSQYDTDDEYSYLFCHELGLKGPEYNKMVAITSEQIDKHIKEFEIKHSTNINIIEEKIGKKVKVEFGVFYDYS